MLKLTILLLLLSGAFSTLTAQQPTPARSDSKAVAQATLERTPEMRRKVFGIVWRTVKEQHFGPNFGGVDWAGMRVQYEPRVAAARAFRLRAGRFRR